MTVEQGSVLQPSMMADENTNLVLEGTNANAGDEANDQGQTGNTSNTKCATSQEILESKLAAVKKLYSIYKASICWFVGLDFDTNEKDLQLSTPVNLPIDQTQTTVTLTPAAIPAIGTTQLFLLKIGFMQQLNGSFYSLKNGAYNSLHIAEVL